MLLRTPNRLVPMLVLMSLCLGPCVGVTSEQSTEPATVPHTDDPELARLVDWMTGAFSSAAQAEADDDFFDIRLHMVRIWPERTDGAWLYVEQAAASSLDAPYRQRIYRVHRIGPVGSDSSVLESAVFTFDDAAQWAGAWRTPERFAELEIDNLQAREGCAILMRQRGEAFIGSTLGRLCTSDLRGATWASSEVVITADRLISWDRGWDDAGEQVWGAVTSGYVFDKTEDL